MHSEHGAELEHVTNQRLVDTLDVPAFRIERVVRVARVEGHS